MSRNSTNKCENVPTWDELEFILATEIVEESRKKQENGSRHGL